MKHSPRWLALFTLLVPALHSAQSNQIPGLDIRLSAMRGMEAMGRLGAFPNGMNGIAVATTVCNQGTVEVPWFQAMNVAHPKIAFLIAAVRDGRIEQISDRSYVKHGFFAANTNGCNTTCIQPGGTIGQYLGIGCSDTYDTGNNGDNYYLAPAEEVDPWLGTWTRACSLFDRGFPSVGPPGDCDGHRSFTPQQAAAMGPVGSRMHISDQDLVIGGALYVQGQYVVEGQPEAARADSTASRLFSASWNGTRWDLSISGNLLAGSILQRWPGADVSSNTNGAADGRVFVAVKVSGPVDGFYHYEYALHNRDNARGVGALHVPKCPGARVRGAGFRDFDADPSNDWTAAIGANEVSFSSAAAPLRWNTIENFWFDSDAAPGAGALRLDAFDAGAGAPSFDVVSSAPTELYNAFLGAGCAPGTPPSLFASGAPPRATLGNTSFALVSKGNEPLQANYLFYGEVPGTLHFRGCTIYIGGTFANVLRASLTLSDGSGVATHSGPIPSDLSLEGKSFYLQAVGRAPGGGSSFSGFQLSDGLGVRVGNAVSGCP